MRHLAFLALPLALAACSQDAPEAPEVAETAPAETAAEAVLDLQATGLIVPPQDGFEQFDVPFGSMRAATEATLANLLGEPTGSREGGGDCLLDSTQYEGLTLNFSDGLLVGYYATSPYVDGLPQRAELLADSGVALVEGSTLGEEFTIGAGDQIISGIFAGEGDDASVESLWAGKVCIAR